MRNAFESVIRPSISRGLFCSRVIAILVPAKAVSMTLTYLLHFYFEPNIF